MPSQGDKDTWGEHTVETGKSSFILTAIMAVQVSNLDYAKDKQQWWVQKRTIPIIRELKIFNFAKCVLSNYCVLDTVLGKGL